jgi:hypothetical protein
MRQTENHLFILTLTLLRFKDSEHFRIIQGRVPALVIQYLMMLTGNVENTCCAVCSLVDISSAVWAARLPRGRSRRARSSRRCR